MSSLNKYSRRLHDAIERWEEYISDGGCSSFDEYLKSVATLRTYRQMLLDVEESEQDEVNEGS